MTFAHWIGLVAAVVIPLLVRHVRYRSHVTESESVTPEWLRRNR